MSYILNLEYISDWFVVVNISHYLRMFKIIEQISYNGMTFKMLGLFVETKGINFPLFGGSSSLEKSSSSLKVLKIPIAINALW